MKAVGFATIVVLICSNAIAGTGAKGAVYTVADNHPTGGAGATGNRLTLKQGDPRIQGPGKCGNLFLGGFAFGHPDPRIKDPSAVCGHGLVIRLHAPITGPAPLSILPIEAPMPVESGGSAADAAKLIRDMLPKLDKAEGDQVAAVVQLRQNLRAMDSLISIKSTPKRQPR
jgi:hypothetical protein